MHVGLAGSPWSAVTWRPRRTHLQRATSSARTPACRRTRTGGGSRMARPACGRGGPRRRVELLDEAQRGVRRRLLPDVQPVAARLARVLVARGDLADAHAPGRASTGSAPTTSSSYLREYEHVTLARVLLAAASDHGAVRTARRLTRACSGRRRGRAGGPAPRRDPARRSSCSRADDAAAATAAACARPALERARVLAAAGGLRARVLGGPHVVRPVPSWTRRPDAASRSSPTGARRSRPGRVEPRLLVDPLSERELDVLRLLALRPRRPRHRAGAGRLAEHRAHPHQAHLRQARRQQPPRRRHAGPTSSACCTTLADPGTEDHHRRSPPWCDVPLTTRVPSVPVPRRDSPSPEQQERP